MNTKEPKDIYYLKNNEIYYNKHQIESIFKFGWNTKGCYYFHYLWDYIDIPEQGDIIQIGSALGCSLEILHQKWGDRVWGIDPWNPLKHPRIIESKIEYTPDRPCAFIHCDLGDFRETPDLRKFGLRWSLKNLVQGGICLTAGDNDYVEEALGWKISDVAHEFNCEVRKMPEQLKNKNENFNTDSECLLIKR